MSRRAVAALAVVLAVVAGGLVGWRLLTPTTPLADALSYAPAATSRASWTDWEDVRRELGVEVDAESSAEDVAAFLTEAFTADLSPMSALGTSGPTMQTELGISPATLRWELLAQSADGAVDVLGVDEDTSFDDLAERLADLGWTEPDDEGGVWVGGPGVLARIDTTLTPELQHVALLPDRHVVLVSDQAPYLEKVLDVARGDADGADGLADLSSHLDEPVAAAVYDGDYTCEHLAMAQADDGERAEADQLVADAGGVHPLTGFAMAALPGGDLRAVLQVEDPDDAPGDADARARLAAGPAPGQGGDFTDRFTVASAESQGREITLELRPQEGAYVLSDLTSGPVLFATC